MRDDERGGGAGIVETCEPIIVAEFAVKSVNVWQLLAGYTKDSIYSTHIYRLVLQFLTQFI